jgi:hypothetical protein
MGISKKDYGRRKANMKARVAELEKLAVKDPLKRNFKLHDELAQLKKELAQEE